MIGTFGPASPSDGWHTLSREVEMRDTPLLGEILWEWVNRELPAEPASAKRVATVVQATGGEPSRPPVGCRREVHLWHRDRNACSAELIGDCEAFLAGHVAERIEGRAASVPAWAWTNLLAHGSEHDLRSERAVVRPRQVTSDDEWRAARSYLAVEVLNLAAEFGSLADLQRRVLVPLEQRLASRPEVAGWRPRSGPKASKRRWTSTARRADGP